MDQEKICKAINITKRDGHITPSKLRDELNLNNEEIQTILQSFIDTDFVDHKYNWTGPATNRDKDKAKEYDRLKSLSSQVINICLTILFAGFIIFFATQPQGVSSCIEDFLDGNISIQLLQSECPNVDESSLIQSVTERYPNGPIRDQLLSEIDSVYLSDEEFEEMLKELN
jgi:hypothetical protein